MFFLQCWQAAAGSSYLVDHPTSPEFARQGRQAVEPTGSLRKEQKGNERICLCDLQGDERTLQGAVGENQDLGYRKILKYPHVFIRKASGS